MLSTWTVHALLEQDTFDRLAQAAGRRYDLKPMSSAEAITRAVVLGASGTVVPNPTLLRWDAVESIVNVLAASGVRLIVYGPASQAFIDAALRVVEHIPIEAVVASYSQDRVALRSLLRPQSRWSLLGRILREVRPQLRGLPPLLRAALARPLLWDSVPRSAHSLAEAAGESLRSIERQLARVGFQATVAVLRCLRMARAWEFAQNPFVSQGEIAKTSGYDSVRTFQENSNRVLGYPMRSAVSELTDEESLTRLVESLRVRH